MSDCDYAAAARYARFPLTPTLSPGERGKPACTTRLHNRVGRGPRGETFRLRILHSAFCIPPRAMAAAGVAAVAAAPVVGGGEHNVAGGRIKIGVAGAGFRRTASAQGGFHATAADAGEVARRLRNLGEQLVGNRQRLTPARPLVGRAGAALAVVGRTAERAPFRRADSGTAGGSRWRWHRCRIHGVTVDPGWFSDGPSGRRDVGGQGRLPRPRRPRRACPVPARWRRR